MSTFGSPELVPGSTASGSASSPAEGFLRRERAAVAAQACETCRSRKSKCDEKRPKCTLCTRLSVECRYREPQPTKKDKTLVYIMDTLSRMEGKLDQIGVAVHPDHSPTAQRAAVSTSHNAPAHTPVSNTPSIRPSTAPQPLQPSSPSNRNVPSKKLRSQLSKAYEHLTTPHKIILWPAVYLYVLNSGTTVADELQHIVQDGTTWFLKQEHRKHQNSLPAHVCLTDRPIDYMISLGRPPRRHFAELTIELMQRYTESYFGTYHVLYPILDRDDFVSSCLTPTVKLGFGDGDYPSMMTLFVCALGKMAYEGTWGAPLEQVDGGRSGLRGGSYEHPPGLEIFNEALRRFGLVFSSCSLENVQCLLLTAVYYEACSRHTDFWRCCASASMGCQVMIKCEEIDWDTKRGAIIKRVYWTCNLIENWYHLDLDLPQTGICDYEDDVPLPGDTNPGDRSVESETVNLHFLAIIALRRLVSRIRNAIFDATNPAESPDDYHGPPIRVMSELARQLEVWRDLLPEPLQWRDEKKLEFPVWDAQGNSRQVAFAEKAEGMPREYGMSLDILTAQLRSRYYYARSMIYRPFVYKCLHFYGLTSQEEREGAAMCLNSALMWPIALAPPSEKKRLVPYLFAWTQNFLAILLVLRLATKRGPLFDIAAQYVNMSELQDTIYLMLYWMHDMRLVDGTAQWSWNILKQLWPEAFSAANAAIE